MLSLYYDIHFRGVPIVMKFVEFSYRVKKYNIYSRKIYKCKRYVFKNKLGI